MKVQVHPWVYLSVEHLKKQRPWLRVSLDNAATPHLELLTNLLRYAARLPLPAGSEREIARVVLNFEAPRPAWQLGGPSERGVVMGEVARMLSTATRCHEQGYSQWEDADMFREFLEEYAVLSLWAPNNGFMCDALEYALGDG